MAGIVEFRQDEQLVATYAELVNKPAFKLACDALRNTLCAPTSPMRIQPPGISKKQVAAFLLGVSCGRHEMLDAVQHLHEASIEVAPLEETYKSETQGE